MNTILFFAVCLAVIAVALSISCGTDVNNDCRHIKCEPDDDYERACVNGTCTCIASRCHKASCSGRPDNCKHDTGVHGCTCDHDWHCIDGHCACGFHVVG
ncbi:metallothionein-B-like [Gigantopelta aegis]|uniref:metallothionein-B-like n=1 Tax=Gigantopelta aegis TaxID=1735272 RepID=UPI001B887A46|nr:metallothionein-B-like [Gigantopelta aegis]XP_041352404.1 metallothionein-B-like [Gigantopelta aegis]